MKASKRARLAPGRWAIRTTAIFASTVAAIDLLNQQYSESFTLLIAWLLIVIAEKRIFPPKPAED